MAFVFLALAGICGLAAFVCAIIILIKMFQDNVVSGVIGLFCGIWIFIWGWMHLAEDGVKKTMLIWTGCIGGAIVCELIAGVLAASASR